MAATLTGRATASMAAIKTHVARCTDRGHVSVLLRERLVTRLGRGRWRNQDLEQVRSPRRA